jgi:hypothetical protein
VNEAKLNDGLVVGDVGWFEGGRWGGGFIFLFLFFYFW